MDIPELIRKEVLRRGLSIMTIKTYRQCIKQFFRRCDEDPKQVKKNDIKECLDRLIENGYDVASVQSLLGHSSAETTMVYVHMASPRMINVISPIESL